MPLVLVELSISKVFIGFGLNRSCVNPAFFVFSSAKIKAIEMNYCYPAQTIFMFFNKCIAEYE